MAESLDLPPGFRFHPTDEEIITHYLSPKITNHNFTARAIGEADLNKCEPWDLPSKAKMGEKEWYFFCQKDRKYPTGMRTNRATGSGYWKATGKDKEIFRGKILVGMKKTLVFYTGRAPKGEKTNWVMHEYRLESKSSISAPKHAKEDDWAVCRVVHKNSSSGAKKSTLMMTGATSMNSSSTPSLPPLMDYSRPSSSNYYFNTNLDESRFDYEGTTTTMNPSSSYFSTVMRGMENDEFLNQIPLQNPYYLQQQHRYYDQEAAARKCKVEQFANNHSLVSEETGMSTDHEIQSRYDSADNIWKC